MKNNLKLFSAARKISVVSTILACLAIASYEISMIPPVWEIVWLIMSIVVASFLCYYIGVIIKRRESKVRHMMKNMHIVDLDMEEV